MGLSVQRFAALTNVRSKTKIPVTAGSRGKMVMNFLRSQRGGIPEGRNQQQGETKEYFAYHLLKCENFFANPPVLLCEHCVPPIPAVQQSNEGRASGKDDNPGRWTRIVETIAPGSAWGYSNEGGDGRVTEGNMCGGGPVASDASVWPKTAWLRNEAAAIARSLQPDDV